MEIVFVASVKILVFSLNSCEIGSRGKTSSEHPRGDKKALFAAEEAVRRR